jgi:hypothetical protein
MAGVYFWPQSQFGGVGMKRDSEDKNNLSRRNFAKTAVAGVCAAALAGLAAQQAEAQTRPPHWHM